MELLRDKRASRAIKGSGRFFMAGLGNILSAVFISLSWGAASLLAASAASGQAAEPFVRWSIVPPTDYPADGRARLSLILEASHPDLKVEKPVSFYRLTRLRRFNQEGDREQSVVLSQGWETRPDGAPGLVLNIGESAKVDVFAKAEIHGRSCFAQTTLYVFGRGETDDTAAVRLAEPPIWPEFKITSDGEFYWPQTGQEFTLRLSGFYSSPADENLTVWDNGFATELTPVGSHFAYRPKRDPALDRAGAAAFKTLVFVARNGSGGSASFTLPVHRSRRDGSHLAAGVGLFGVGAAVAGLAVWATRRRFAPCR